RPRARESPPPRPRTRGGGGARPSSRSSDVPELPEDVVEQAVERLRLEGLAEVPVRAGLARAARVLGLAFRRDRDDREVLVLGPRADHADELERGGRRGADDAEELEAGEGRHVDVGEDEVEGAARELAERLEAVGRLADSQETLPPLAARRERFRDEEARRGRVVDHEDAQREDLG